MSHRRSTPRLWALAVLVLFAAHRHSRAEFARLLAYYPFEEGTGDLTRDAAGNCGDAQIVGDALFTPGKHGLALGLTGFADWVDTGKCILNTARSHSVAAWVKLGDGFDADFRTAVSQDSDRVSGFYLQFNPPKLGCAPDRLTLIKWNRPEAERFFCVHSAERPRANEWIHLVGVVDTDRDRLLLYVNGELAQESRYDAAGGQFEFNAPGHTIIGRGQFAGKPVDFFLGAIDEVYLFEGVLSAEDVRRVWNNSYLPRQPKRGVLRKTDDAHRFTIDLASAKGTISPLLFGQNLEHTRLALWQGLSAQLIANRKFAGKADDAGAAPSWTIIGQPDAKAYLASEKPYTGTQSQRIAQPTADVWAGIAQDSVPLMRGREYEFKVAARSDKPTQLVICILLQDGEKAFESKPLNVDPAEWRQLNCTLQVPRTDEACRVALRFKGPATVWFGAVSLLPNDHFMGMRTDVIDSLSEIGTTLLRWPGGNFTLDYQWRDGLLPVDQRPPIASDFSETLPFTNGVDFHEIGTDEFIELCRKLHAEPCITINLNPRLSSPPDAAAWVEYCNGNSSTKWGKTRAERGHPEPFNVKYWSIGNEVWGTWMKAAHFDAATYAGKVAQYATAMRKADPSILLIASGQPGNWDETLLTQAGAHFDLLSEHNYAPPVPRCAGPAADRQYARLARYPETELLPLLQATRGLIAQRAGGKQIGVSLDEWNVWHDWFFRPHENAWSVTPIDAVYAASAIHMFCRQAQPLGLTISAFFQPVQEGAIAVEPFAAHLTPLGQVLAIMKVHQGARFIEVESSRPGSGVDVCASTSPNGKALRITMVNRNPEGDRVVDLAIKGAAGTRTAALRVLRAPQLTPYSEFQAYDETVPVRDGSIELRLPKYGVALLELSLK